MLTINALRPGRHLRRVLLLTAPLLFVSVAPAAAGGVVTTGLTITYTAAPGEANDVTLAYDGNAQTISLNDLGGGTFDPFTDVPVTCTLTDGDRTVVCPAADIPLVLVDLGDDADTAAFAGWTSAPVAVIEGGSGNDALTGSSEGDVLRGGPGDDDLDGGPGADTLSGGTGADVLTGGPGADTVTYADRVAPDGLTTRLTVTLDGIADDGVPFELDNVGGPDNSVEHVTGGSADDTITGNAADNSLLGGPGEDLLYGLDGADTLDGEGDDDTLDGGDDADTLEGGPGIDTTSYATRSAGVTVTLGADNDDGNTADGAVGFRDDVTTENVTGGSGADTLTGDESVNLLSGGPGVDAITSRDAAADAVNCGTGTDATVIADLNDVLTECETVDTGPVPALTIADLTVVEGDAGTSTAVVTVTSSPVPSAPITVDYATSDGSAVQPGDYASTSGQLVFAPGQDTRTISVPVSGDTLDEPDETFGVTLSSAQNATITDATAEVTITDDDAAPTLSIAPGQVTEGNDGTSALTLQVTASKPAVGPMTVRASTADVDATAGGDYEALTSALLTIPAGQTQTEAVVTVTGDTAVEPDETLTVTLSDATGATLDGAVATATIVNDDVAVVDPVVVPVVVPAVTIGDVRLGEGNAGTSVAAFPIVLDRATTVPVTVKVTTLDNTARTPGDYVASSGTVTIAAGQTSTTFPVLVNGDVVVELDETLGARLSEPVNATLASKTVAVATITDDDALGSAGPRDRPRLTAAALSTRDRTAPFSYRITGRLVPPAGMTDACRSGVVAVTLRVGTRKIRTATAALRTSCRYTVRATIRSSRDVRSVRRRSNFNARVRFGGNPHLLPAAKTLKLRAG